MPYLFILFLAVGLLVMTIVAGRLEALAGRHISVFGELFTMNVLSATLLYLMGVFGEILMLTAIYLVMPVGRLSMRHALIGGVAAGLLWELTRHVLVWYYGTLSQIQTVYGSLTTAIATLLSVEIAAVVLLLGAQVISEYERIGHKPVDATPSAMQLDQARRHPRPPRRVKPRAVQAH
jgi:YihY family inner membrane protein